jgi:exonuclease SbcC
LQNLADVANVRFHRMTKNQLSLTINSSIWNYWLPEQWGFASVKRPRSGFSSLFMFGFGFGRKRSILNKNDKTSLSMKALGPKILKVSLSFWNVAIAL